MTPLKDHCKKCVLTVNIQDIYRDPEYKANKQIGMEQQEKGA